MTAPKNSGECKPKKIAVVAIHGISDQKPYESARSIADLLLDRTDPSQSQYAPFNERQIRLKVTPVQPKKLNIGQQQDRETKSWLMTMISKLWRSTNERGPYMHMLLTGKLESKDHDAVLSPDYLFIRDQIEQYTTQSVYESICLEGERNSATKSPARVDVYEMYWGDLSRLGSGFVRIFGEFYQLLFHLGSLGRQSIDLARAENQNLDGGFNIWGLYSGLQAWTARCLSLVLPILNLCLLIAASISLVGQIPPDKSQIAASGSLGFLLILAIAYGLLRTNMFSARSVKTITQNDPSHLMRWVLFSLCGLGGALAINAILSPAWIYPLLAVECGLIVGAMIWVVLVRPYDKHRPGATPSAAVAALCLLLLTFYCLGTEPNLNSPLAMTWVSLRMVEIIYAILLMSWTGMFGLYFSTLVLGIITTATQVKPAKNPQSARASAQLAAISLALPAMLFSFFTLALWSALVKLAAPILSDKPLYHPLLFFRQNKTGVLTADFIDRLTLFSGSSNAIPILLFTSIAILLTLWALIPSILTEIFPPQAKDRDNNFAAGLGNWLTNGLWLVVYFIAAVILCWVIPSFFLRGSIDGLKLIYSGADVHVEDAKPILGWVAGFLTLSATSLIAFGERLNTVSLGFRGILDAILDVDNYLRMHPLTDNPSARIYARYVSLLRYLAASDPAYDAVIIVAHSQGTVITADLLRFLEQDRDPVLEQSGKLPPIYLFTMGSPLKQLYSVVFPYLYDWMIPTESSIDPLDLHSNPQPDQLLNVRSWTNTFRSGDYVGRYLWRSNHRPEQWHKVQFDQEELLSYPTQDPNLNRREFCLGAGAHTHYWDATAPEVAQEIDRLIEGVCQQNQI
jgi:hypothetical protein